MGKNLFETAKFNFAWEMPLRINLFRKDYAIVVSADAYYSTDKVTDEQEHSYEEFLSGYQDIIINVEKMLLNEAGTESLVHDRFTPKLLKIKRNGCLGLVFDDKNDMENGLVISIFPKFEMMSTDEYL